MFESSALGAIWASRSNMPPAPIEGSCARVADRHELCPAVLHDLGEPVEAVGVRHAGLVEVDRRVAVDVRAGRAPRARRARPGSRSDPASAGLSRPSRCAVDPDTAIPSV